MLQATVVVTHHPNVVLGFDMVVGTDKDSDTLVGTDKDSDSSAGTDTDSDSSAGTGMGSDSSVGTDTGSDSSVGNYMLPVRLQDTDIFPVPDMCLAVVLSQDIFLLRYSDM